MSLRETALVTVMAMGVVPVVAGYIRHRAGLAWMVLLASAVSVSVCLGMVWRLVAVRTDPEGFFWAQGLLACGVPVLVSGYLFSGVLGRKNPGRALRAMSPFVIFLLGGGLLTLVFLPNRTFLTAYGWHGGTGILTLGALGKAYLGFLLVGMVFVARNLESAFRLAQGPEAARLKPVVLALFGVLGFLAYLLTVGLVYGEIDLDNMVALVVPLAVAYLATAYGFLRGSLVDTAVPVSRGVVYSSFTTMVAVFYFVAMGVAAELATLTGWTPGHVVTVSFVFLVVLVAVVFLFSDRFKRGVRRFIDRNFYVNRYDYRTHWARITADLDPSAGTSNLLASSERLVRDVFDAEKVTIALKDSTSQCWRVVQGEGRSHPGGVLEQDSPICREFMDDRRAILLDARRNSHPSTAALRTREPEWFAATGSDVLAPLFSGDELLGVIGLARKRSGDPFTFEDLELLDCTAAQVAAALRGAEWGKELADVREVELLSNWSNMLLHDFKNYLSPLRMIVQNMRRHFDNREFQAEAVEDIAAVTKQMEDLMLRLSDLRKGHSHARQVVGLGEVVKAALDALQVDAHPGLEVVARIDTTAGVVGDQAMLHRVVENLVTNAIQAMDGVGTLEVFVETRPSTNGAASETVLTVGDTGPGMEEPFIRERLFRPFATTRETGLGLGLYQCRTIVHAHGGEILVDSEPGQGTVFRVVLPGVSAPASRAAEEKEPEVSRSAS